jgi:hypothetical protein
MRQPKTVIKEMCQKQKQKQKQKLTAGNQPGTYYISSARTSQKTPVTCKTPVHWFVTSAGRGADDIENTASSNVT